MTTDHAMIVEGHAMQNDSCKIRAMKKNAFHTVLLPVPLPQACRSLWLPFTIIPGTQTSNSQPNTSN